MLGVLSSRTTLRSVTIVFFFAALLVAAAGCGGKKARRSASLGRAGEGDLVTIEGTLASRGSQPHVMLVLETDAGGDVVIQSSDLTKELKRLTGMKVSIEGRVLPAIDGETPLVSPLSYTLLALPSGEVPIVGELTLVEDECVLRAEDGKLYWIRGDFTELIRDFLNAKVWVVGSVGDAALPGKPEGTVPIWVTGYGVLSER